MALINWGPELSVNVSEIDLEHRKLVNMLNQLHEAMSHQHGKDVIGPILASLAEYAATHFKTEEKYFDQFNYPDAELHKREHRDFTLRVSNFQKAYEEDRAGLTVEVLHFLSGWLQNHIQGSDKKYSKFFNAHGLH